MAWAGPAPRTTDDTPRQSAKAPSEALILENEAIMPSVDLILSVCIRVLIESIGNMIVCSITPAKAPASNCDTSGELSGSAS